MADAVLVVELALGHGVVDVDGREQQLALLRELVQTVHACGGFLGDAFDAGGQAGPLLRISGKGPAQEVQDEDVFLRIILSGGRHGSCGFEFDAL